jgi:hypothetical protein
MSGHGGKYHFILSYNNSIFNLSIDVWPITVYHDIKRHGGFEIQTPSITLKKHWSKSNRDTKLNINLSLISFEFGKATILATVDTITKVFHSKHSHVHL